MDISPTWTTTAVLLAFWGLAVFGAVTANYADARLLTVFIAWVGGVISVLLFQSVRATIQH